MNWQQWSLWSNGLRWRIALPADQPAIDALLDATDRRIGPQDRPDLFDAPVMITLVAEDADGRIVDGCYVEMVAHIAKLGLDRRAFAAADEVQRALIPFLLERKVRLALIAVPQRLTRIMAESMKRLRFTRTDDRLSHWVLMLKSPRDGERRNGKER